jgi:predicted permease
MERVLRWLLLLSPRTFREQFGEEILATHATRAEHARTRGRTAALLLAVREVAGIVQLIVGLRAGAAWRQDGGASGGERRKGGRMFAAIVQDIRFAVRTLGRSPGYALAAMVVLALGVGATAAMFSAVNAFFYRPLPFADESRLAIVYETNPEFGWTDATAAPANLLDWREQVEAFDDVAGYSEIFSRVPYVLDGEPVLVRVATVTGNFFSVLGASPVLGRTFRWEETWQGNDAVVMLSHGLWTTHFGADADIIGRRVEFGGTVAEVVGVMPPGFSYPSADAELWTPIGWGLEERDQTYFRRGHYMRTIARLAPGVTWAEAAAQLDVVVQRLQREYPETNRVMGAGIMPVRDFLIREVRTPLLILLGAVILLLLLACANVANLTLVRTAGRAREVAVRQAMGAGRLRVARQLITESLILATAGGAIGLVLGNAGVRLMERLTTLGIDGATSVTLDYRVVLFTVLAATVSGILFGLGPALRAAGGDMRGPLMESSRGASSGRQTVRLTRLLVAAEVAIALLLVIGAGLMMRSYSLIRQVDPGFRMDGVLAVQFTVPAARYAERDHVLAFYDRFLESLEARPGITRAGTVAQLPLNGTVWSSQFQARGWPPERVGFEILHRRADRGYFETLDIPLIRGRMFGPGDRSDGPRVVLINETFAREYFPGEDPIGQSIAYDRAATDQSRWSEIIGIVADQHQTSPAQPARAEAFENRNQDWGRNSWVVLRTDGDPLRALSAVREVLRESDPLIPIAQAQPLREVWKRSMVREEFILTLLAAFGVMALILATVGVYAVTAQAARTRTREIGIRMALGARRPAVLTMMMRQSLTVVGLGLVAGLGLALLATRALASVLYGIAPTDPPTLAAVVMLLAIIGAVAGWVPARRATRVDPANSLRVD